MRVYEASEIGEKLGLDRERLVALALLVGCDYTQGVRSIGKEYGTKLLKCWKDGSVLDRYNI